MSELEPITPREAYEMYLEDIDGDLSPNSVNAKQYQLGFFIDWCEGQDTDEQRIENLNNITGIDATDSNYVRGRTGWFAERYGQTARLGN